MLRSRLALPALMLLSTAISSCAIFQAPIDVYDKEVCANLGDIVYQGVHIGARCKHTLTDKARTVPLLQWRNKKAIEGGSIGLLCMDSQAFADVETAIEQACQFISCDYKTREALQAALARVAPIAKLAKKAGGFQ